MSANALTRDNPSLSRLTMGAETVPQPCAINCTLSVNASVAGYVRDSLANNTRRAYLSMANS
jgi:hypothetical protein